MSYRNAQWVPGAPIRADYRKATLLRSFYNRETADGVELLGGVPAEWHMVERIIAQRGEGEGAEYLTKWCGLGYTDATWETVANLVDDQALRYLSISGAARCIDTIQR